MRLNILDDELTRTIKQVAKQHLNSFQPRPKRGRRQRLKPSPEIPIVDVRGLSASEIPAATGDTVGPIYPGVGYVRVCNAPKPFAGNPQLPAGSGWEIAVGTVTAENWMFSKIAPNKPILLRESRTLSDGTTIYTIISEGCAPVPSHTG